MLSAPNTFKPEMESALKSFLSVELVPSTCWFSNVRSHVSSEDWDRLRRMTYARAGRLCEICCTGPGIRLDAHEVWHYDDENLVQKLTGMQALCIDCHRVKHAGLAAVNGEIELVIKHLMKVNHWEEERAKVYLGGCFDVWERRSASNWKLDISYLDPYAIRVISRRAPA